MASNFSIIDEIMKFFECPVCMTYMVPPIFQCVARHKVCCQCYFRIDRCPLCRGPMGGRSPLAELLSLKLEVPCQYADDGCPVRGKSYTLKTHEVGCQFSCRMCPLSKLRACEWTGQLKNLLEHFKQKHPQLMYFEPEPKLTSYGMWQRTSRRSVSMLFVFDTLFQFCWEFIGPRDQFRFSVTYYGCPGKEDRFSYTICILDGDRDSEALRMTAHCHYTVQDDVGFMIHQFYVSVHFLVIEAFLTSSGNLRFAVKIRNNDSELTLPSSSNLCAS